MVIAARASSISVTAAPVVNRLQHLRERARRPGQVALHLESGRAAHGLELAERVDALLVQAPRRLAPASLFISAPSPL